MTASCTSIVNGIGSCMTHDDAHDNTKIQAFWVLAWNSVMPPSLGHAVYCSLPRSHVRYTCNHIDPTMSTDVER